MPLSRFSQIFLLLICVSSLPALAAPPTTEVTGQTEPTPQIVTATIRLDDLSMIIVPVSINGSGPYDLLLDTGCAKTMVDQKLADELGLPQVGERKIMGVLGSTKMSVVRANSVSVAGATISDLNVSSTANRMSVFRVRGVLGQDFLQQFDVLIDYRHLILQLAPASGALAQLVTGEHLALHMDQANPGRGAPNRLIISGYVPELGAEEMSLLLDSGANCFTLFHDNLGPIANRSEPVNTGTFGSWTKSEMAISTIRVLRLGKKSVPDLTMVTLSHPMNTDTDGLVPTSLFNSVFISSREGFVILNPTLRKASR
jgi:predicted aspartyl protease